MTVVKASLFFFFIRFINYFFYYIPSLYQDILIISALGSLIIGCFGSLYQHGIKRLFAYGSISQVGFSLIGILCNSVSGIISSLMFFTIYIIASMGIFAILLNTEAFFSGRNMVSLSDLSNFSKYNMLAAVYMSLFLLSMAGIPPLAGFFGKLFIFISTISANYYGLTVGVIILSTINVFVYVRIVKILWSDIVILIDNKSKESKTLLYDIFIMNLPKNWHVNNFKSLIFYFYEN
jgi:NADH-quinone oxidoreductase subunit N